MSSFGLAHTAWVLAQGSVFAIVACAGLPAFAQSGPGADVAQTGVEDIVVTAQRREENLQRVPISITAVSAATIENARITNVSSLSSIAPNLTVIQSGGGNAIPNYSMRGVLAANSIPGADNGISLYIDGVYIARPNGSLFDIADLQRIEVLKGPQGTLFGRNSTGGAISIITREPTGKLGIKQELTYGNYRQFRAKTRIDLPAWGPLSASLSYYHDQRRGDIRNLGAGATFDYSLVSDGRFGKIVSPKYLGSTNTDAVQAKLKFDPGGGFVASYKFDYTDLHYTAPGAGFIGIDPSVPQAGGLATLIYATQPNPPAISLTRPDAVNNSQTGPSHTRNWGHLLTMSYQASDSITFKNILAYRANRASDFSQLDGTGGLVVTAPVAAALGLPAALVGSPITLLPENALNREHQWSNEFQMNITTQWFNITSGLYYFSSRLSSGGHGNGLTTAFQIAPGGVIIDPQSPPSLYKSRSIAAYSQATFHLTDKLDVVGGLRITKDTKSGVDATSFVQVGLQSFSYRDSRPTWLAGLNYQAAPNVMAYAKASTGYISGGRIGGLDYKPESVRSYEGGVKADLFDRKLRTNLAIFYAKYNNLQFTTLSDSGALAYSNAGKSRAWGGEFEATLVPVTGLTLQANAGYTNFKYTEIDFSSLTIYGAGPDNFFPAVRPKITASGVIQYESEPIAFGGRLLARIEGNYRSKYYHSVAIPPFGSYPANSVATHPFSPATFLLNGRLGLTDIDLMGTKAQVAVWAKNITNRRELTHVANLTFVYAAVYQPARTFGLDVSFAF